jgi:hypothetical protein
MAPRHAAFPTTPLLLGARRHPNGTILQTYPDPVHDAVRFCKRIMDEAMANWGMHLEPEEYEDSIQELLIHAVRLEKRFDPERNDSFAGYARAVLSQRAVDAGPRRIIGRTGNRLAERQHEELDEASAGKPQPWESHTPIPSDPGDHHLTDLGRLQSRGDSSQLRYESVLGVGASSRTPPRDVRADGLAKAAT